MKFLLEAGVEAESADMCYVEGKEKPEVNVGQECEMPCWSMGGLLNNKLKTLIKVEGRGGRTDNYELVIDYSKEIVGYRNNNPKKADDWLVKTQISRTLMVALCDVAIWISCWLNNKPTHLMEWVSPFE